MCDSKSCVRVVGAVSNPAGAVVLPGDGGVSGASALAGNGELAYVAAGRLYLLGGSAGTLHRVSLPGLASAPGWSPDHRWLAVQVTPPTPASNPFQAEPT